MSEKSPEQIESEAKAQSDLEDIIRLRQFPPFRYFMRRIREKKLDQQSKVLDPSTPNDALIGEKNLLRVWDEIENLLANDEAGCRNILGIDPNELPDNR
jgi:hypothetical protein